MIRCLLLFAALFCFTQSKAQTTDQNYPVTTQAFVVAQPNQKLATYFASNQAVTVSLLLKDLTKTSIQVYLRWSIDGAGVHLSSIDGHIPARFITLQRGMMQRLSGLDLQNDYFLSNLILAEGLAGPPLRTSLPEGFYTFRVQALEAGTGREVSNWGETYFSITTPLPPVINIPFNGAELSPTEAQKNGVQPISIQWMPRHYRLPGSTTSYDLKVCKVPDGYEPTEALEACVNPIIDEKGNPGTFYPGNTGIGNSSIGAFEVGEKYAARVTIHEFDANGDQILFANEGRSEVTWFRFGKLCVSPATFAIKEIGPGRLQLTWEPLDGVDSYTIFFRKEGANQWTSQSAMGTTTFITNLVPGSYELAVQASCSKQFPDNIQIWEIEDESDDWEELPLALTDPMQLPVQAAGCMAVTPGKLSDYYANFPGQEPDSTKKLTIPACALVSSTYTGCSDDHPVITPPTTGTELTELKTGDVLGIYDFTVFVAEAVATPEGFTGKGFVRMPFLEGALIPADFSGVKAWKSDGNGGCVYASARFESKSQTEVEITSAMSKLMTTLASQNSPTTYAGTLAGALQQYDGLSAQGDSSQLCPYKAAILQASKEFKAALEEAGGEDPDPRLTVLLQELEAITSPLEADSILPNLTQKYEDLFARLDQLKKQLEEESTPPDYQITNIQVSNLQTQSAKLAWQLSGGEVTRYVIEYRDPDGATLLESLENPQVNLQRLKENTTYRYTILAYQGDNIVATSAGGYFTTLQRVVPRPENLAYTILSDSSVKITWDKNTQHKDFKLVYTDGKGNWQAVFPTTNEVTLTGLDPSQLYDYEIVAYDNARVESEAANSQVTTAEQCQLNVTMLNARNTSILKENEHFLWASGCSSTTLPTSIQWSNGTLGVISSDGIITFGDGETGKLVFTNSSSRRIFVNPQKSKSYTAICTMGEGANKKICTYTVDVKVSSNECGEDFRISMSTPDLESDSVLFVSPATTVTLNSSGCDGELEWSSGLGSSAQILLLATADILLHAKCTKGTKVCYSNRVSIKVQPPCIELYVRDTDVKKNKFLWIRFSKTRIANVFATKCSGTIKWRHTGPASATQNGYYYYLEDIKGDVDVFALCEGSGCSEVKLKVSRPEEKCNGKIIYENRSVTKDYIEISASNAIILTNKVKQYNYTPQKKVNVPVLNPNNVYTGEFENGCKSSLLVGNSFRCSLLHNNKGVNKEPYDITSFKTSSYDILEMYPSTRCPGKLVWTNNQDESFAEETNDLTLNHLNFPSVTTEYSATCFANDGTIYKTSNSKTLVVTSDQCIVISGNKSIAKGNTLELFARGCVEDAKWSKDGKPFSVGNKLTDIPLEASVYKVVCGYPACTTSATVTVNPCAFSIKANKSSEKQGDEIILKANGCGTTIIWQDLAGNYLGTGTEIKIAPNETVSIQALCSLTECKASLKVEVPQVLPPKILCEQLVAIAQPAIINKGESNSITLTVSGCTGGQTQWNGPGLAENTIGEGEKGQVMAKEVKDSVRYSVTCIKDVVGTTQAEVKVYAQLRLVVSANPATVEKGKTTTLTATGCGGGTITWQGINKSCSSPCILENQVINEVKTFIAICNSGGEVLTKSITIPIKVVLQTPSGQDYTDIFSSGCSGFIGYANPENTNLVPSYDPGVKIKLQTEGCSGQVTWEIMDSTRIYGTTHYPRKTTVYVASCFVNNQLCAKSYRLVEIYEFKCDDFIVNYQSKAGGFHEFRPSWCASTNPFESADKKIKLYNSQGYLTREIPIGQISEYRPNELANGALQFSCQPDTRRPDRICYYTFYFNEESQIIYQGRNPYSYDGNARVGNSENTEQATNTTAAGSCQSQYNLADMMRTYFSMLVCSTIRNYIGANNELSESEAKTFLDNLESAVRANSTLNKYLLNFSVVTAGDLVAAMKKEKPCDAAGELLAKVMPGKESNDAFNGTLRNTFTDIAKKMNTPPACAGNALAALYQIGVPTTSGQGNSVSAQFNSSSRLFEFRLNEGFETMGGKNTFKITSVPEGVDSKWLGDYIAYFSMANPDKFLGYYQAKNLGDCTPSYETKENEACTYLCQEGFLPVEYYQGTNLFYDDFISTRGKYYNVNHSETLLKGIETLVKSLMNQEVYEEFLRAGAEKLIAERQVKEITEEDLGDLLTMLTDYKQAMVSMYGNVNSRMMGQVMTFFKSYFELCGSVSSDSTDCALGEYIIPRCWWDNSIVDVGVPVSIPLTAGIIDGAYSTLYGLGQLTGAIVSMKALAECWFNPLTYIWGNRECSARRASTIQSLIFVKDLIDKDSKSSSVVSSFFNDFGAGLTTWKEQTFCFGETAAQGRCCSYHQGKLVFDIASLFFGVGEVKVGLQGFKLGTFLEGKIATQMTGLLRKIKLPTSLLMKPIRKTGLAIGTAAMLAFTDPALVIKPITASAQALVAKTLGKASAQAMARVGEMLQGGATKAINEAVGSLDDIALKLTDELGEEVLKDAGKIILNQKTPLDDIIISHVNKSNVLSPFAVLSLAGTLLRISEIGTPGCEVCKTRSKAICDKYVEVRNRAVSGGLSRAEADTAVNRICAAISTDAGLQEVAGILLTNSTNYMPSLAAMVSFLKDINKNFGKNGIDGNLASFADSRWFRAWTVVFKARCAGVSNCNENTKADWEVLQPIDEMLEHHSVRADYLGGYDGLVEVIKKNNRAPCNTCDLPRVSYLNKMDQYLKDINYFLSQFASKKGADKVLGKQGIRNNSRHQVEATAFVLRALNQAKIFVTQISEFEERIETVNDAGEINTVFADIVRIYIPDPGSYPPSGKSLLIECKSWAAEGIAFQKFVKGDGNAYKQFKTYLGSISSMNALEYWFDGRKANSSQVKEKFQELMYKNGALTTQGVEIFDVIWANTSLKENFWSRNTYPNGITKVQAQIEFVEWVKNLDLKLMNFIKIR